jgi:hypothetical protein
VSVVPAHTLFVLAELTIPAVVAVVGVAAYRLHRLRRALDAERAARRLTAGMRLRDIDALHRRVEGLLRDRAVLAEAERILDTELAAHRTEGGSQ